VKWLVLSRKVNRVVEADDAEQAAFVAFTEHMAAQKKRQANGRHLFNLKLGDGTVVFPLAGDPIELETLDLLPKFTEKWLGNSALQVQGEPRDNPRTAGP
jgi:hypothetical protein